MKTFICSTLLVSVCGEQFLLQMVCMYSKSQRVALWCFCVAVLQYIRARHHFTVHYSDMLVCIVLIMNPMIISMTCFSLGSVLVNHFDHLQSFTAPYAFINPSPHYTRFRLSAGSTGLSLIINTLLSTSSQSKARCHEHVTYANFNLLPLPLQGNPNPLRLMPKIPRTT